MKLQICVFVHPWNWRRCRKFDSHFSDVYRNHQPVIFFFLLGCPPVSFSIIARHWPPQISVATNDLMQGMQVGEPLGFSETSCHDLKRCTEGNTNWAMKKGPVVPGCCCFWGISGMEYFPVNYVGIISNKIQGSILNSHDSMESHRLCFFFLRGSTHHIVCKPTNRLSNTSKKIRTKETKYGWFVKLPSPLTKHLKTVRAPLDFFNKMGKTDIYHSGYA